MRVGSSPNADTSLALLHDSSQNETGVDTGRSSNALNGRLDACDLGRGVVGLTLELSTRDLQDGEVKVPQSLEVDPSTISRPSSAGRAIALVELAASASNGAAASVVAATVVASTAAVLSTRSAVSILRTTLAGRALGAAAAAALTTATGRAVL
jgi:hypothetical protein